MSGDEGYTEVRKAYRWDLPEDASPELVEQERRVEYVKARGWRRAWDDSSVWWHLSLAGRTYTLDQAYALASRTELIDGVSLALYDDGT